MTVFVKQPLALPVSVKIERVALLVTNPPCANFTLHNSPIWKAITSHCHNCWTNNLIFGQKIVLTGWTHGEIIISKFQLHSSKTVKSWKPQFSPATKMSIQRSCLKSVFFKDNRSLPINTRFGNEQLGRDLPQNFLRHIFLLRFLGDFQEGSQKLCGSF